MEVELRINGTIKSLDVAANETLLAALRKEGYASVKQGCETGACGTCAVLIDGTPRPACVTFAAQVGGCTLTTLEGIGSARALHPLQQAFIETGAVGCGFCTPGMILSAYALLNGNQHPSEEEVRDAISGNLCRCTGYIKPVQAVLQAAAMLRGQTNDTKSEPAIDAVKLATGKPVFVNDIEVRGMPGLLYGRLLTSPHAHAVIRSIDTTRARALPGVHAVLTFEDIPRIPYASNGTGAPAKEARDRYSLDSSVRYVGDRVAAVAADTLEIAEQALRLIHVDYEVLPAVLDPRKAMEASDIVAHGTREVGNIERGFAEADLLIEGEYVIPQVLEASLENHAVICYWDEDDRLVVRTNAGSPYAVQHALAQLTNLPARRIRVVAPRTGSSSGAEEGIVLEDICALLAIATHRPVSMAHSRATAFLSSRVQPACLVHIKTGMKRDGSIVANHMTILANSGAYAAYDAFATDSQESMLDGAALALSLYHCANTRVVTDVVYTNLPPGDSSRGNGVRQALFALECHVDEIARQLGLDALELRRGQWRASPLPSNKAGGEVMDEGRGDARHLPGLSQCLQLVEEKLDWGAKRNKGQKGRFRRGVGVALAVHGVSAIGKNSASIKLNEDGSFDVHVGVASCGGDSATMIAQMAAETLGVRLEAILLHTSDTDVTPFNCAVDCASAALIGAGAVIQAAEQVRRQVLDAAGRLLNADPQTLTVQDGVVTALNKESLHIAQVARHALYSAGEAPIMGTATQVNAMASPAFAAQGVEVEVDTETGVVRVLRVVSAVDGGRIINPVIAEGLIEGGAAQALGYGICEELLYNQHGAPLNTGLSDYRIYNAPDMPLMETFFVETIDAAGPFGSKPFADIALDMLAPAIANAVADALGVRIRQLPLTPERVLRAIRGQK